MKFEWDDSKRQTNITKHGIDFLDARTIFDYDMVTIEDNRFNYGEPRFIAIGLLNGKTIVAVYTEINNKIRIISARKATKNERQIYFNEIYD